MGQDFDIVSYTGDKDLFLKYLSPAIASPTEFELESSYRHHENGDGFADLSFHLIAGDKRAATIILHKFNATNCGFSGSGAYLDIPAPSSKIAKAVIAHLIESAKTHNLPSIKIADTQSAAQLSEIGLESYAMGGTAHTKLRALVDLTPEEETIRADIRKSYKSLINQGHQEIAFKIYDKTNITRDIFQAFEDFHLQVAGRKTRSVESWNTQFDMIKSGCGELSMGYMDDYGLVSSALFTDYGDTASYAVAVYNRELFDKPLAHANVYDGMIRAKKRGKIKFNLGIMPFPGEANEKELSIAKFKKGFTGNLNSFIEWIIPV